MAREADDRLAAGKSSMPAVRVHNCAFPQETDIDPTEVVDAEKLDTLGRTCVVRAKEALSRPCPRYSDVQKATISEVLDSLMSTHQTIRKLLGEGFERPESVNALVLARVQVEGLYIVCLMLEDPAWVNRYLQDGWRKRYTSFLLQREEMKKLSRFDQINNFDADDLESLRQDYGITEAQRDTLEYDELGIPAPAGFERGKIEQFPTPGKAIDEIADPARKEMLERLYPEYVKLSSFVHGLPRANRLRQLYGRRTHIASMFPESRINDSFQDQVVEESFLLSFLANIQSAAELSSVYPGDVELRASLTAAWDTISRGWFLGRAVWALRTKKLLGAVV